MTDVQDIALTNRYWQAAHIAEQGLGGAMTTTVDTRTADAILERMAELDQKIRDNVDLHMTSYLHGQRAGLIDAYEIALRHENVTAR